MALASVEELVNVYIEEKAALLLLTLFIQDYSMIGALAVCLAAAAPRELIVPARSGRGSSFSPITPPSAHLALSLRGGSLSMETITEMLGDPEKVKEAMAGLQDPEAMEEVRAMMEDPEFRRQVQEAVAAGGEGGLESLREALGATDLSDELGTLGPPLGAALDVLKTSVLDASEYETALSTLTALLGKLMSSPDDLKFRGLRLANGALEQRLLCHRGGLVALKALGFSKEVCVRRVFDFSSPLHGAHLVSLRCIVDR